MNRKVAKHFFQLNRYIVGVYYFNTAVSKKKNRKSKYLKLIPKYSANFNMKEDTYLKG